MLFIGKKIIRKISLDSRVASCACKAINPRYTWSDQFGVEHTMGVLWLHCREYWNQWHEWAQSIILWVSYSDIRSFDLSHVPGIHVVLKIIENHVLEIKAPGLLGIVIMYWCKYSCIPWPIFATCLMSHMCSGVLWLSCWQVHWVRPSGVISGHSPLEGAGLSSLAVQC